MNLIKPLLFAALTAVASLTFAQSGNSEAPAKTHAAEPSHGASKPMHDKKHEKTHGAKHEKKHEMASAKHHEKAAKADHAASAPAK